MLNGLLMHKYVKYQEIYIKNFLLPMNVLSNYLATYKNLIKNYDST